MIKVITYGTFDYLHQGHINILKRAKALGDYLMVGVTGDDYDISRGKVNVRQSLMERIEAVKNTGIADEVFPEEYIGQKIDDIKRYGIDIFVVGSDWEGKFDYLKEYCKVVYLPRTEGVSSTQIRSDNALRLGVVGEDPALLKFIAQVECVNGIYLASVCSGSVKVKNRFSDICTSYGELLKRVDVVYVAAKPADRAVLIKQALLSEKHVISESPIALNVKDAKELFNLAKDNNLVLFDSIKTAYSLSFNRLVLLVKSGIIGQIKSVDATVTSLENLEWLKKTQYYTSMTGWGAIGLLPIFKLFGLNYNGVTVSTLATDDLDEAFTKVNFVYDSGLATLNVGIGVKSEGDMVISGTKGYVYVRSPWWKSEYFEVRFEDANCNKPYFYSNIGEGLQMELIHFLDCVKTGKSNYYIGEDLSLKICEVMETYEKTKA